MLADSLTPASRPGLPWCRVFDAGAVAIFSDFQRNARESIEFGAYSAHTGQMDFDALAMAQSAYSRNLHPYADVRVGDLPPACYAAGAAIRLTFI